jgi:hypothetical protein
MNCNRPCSPYECDLNMNDPCGFKIYEFVCARCVIFISLAYAWWGLVIHTTISQKFGIRNIYIYIYNAQKVNNVIEGKNILFISPLHLMMLHASLYLITFFLIFNQRTGIIYLKLKSRRRQLLIRMIKCFTWWKLKFLVNIQI